MVTKKRRLKPYRLGHLSVRIVDPLIESSAGESQPEAVSTTLKRPFVEALPIVLTLLALVAVVAFLFVQAVHDIGRSVRGVAAEVTYWLNWLSFAGASISLISASITPFLATTKASKGRRVLTRGGWIALYVSVCGFGVSASSEGIKQFREAEIAANAVKKAIVEADAERQDRIWRKRVDELTNRILTNTSEQMTLANRGLANTLDGFDYTSKNIERSSMDLDRKIRKYANSIRGIKAEYRISFECAGEMKKLCSLIRVRRKIGLNDVMFTDNIYEDDIEREFQKIVFDELYFNAFVKEKLGAYICVSKSPPKYTRRKGGDIFYREEGFTKEPTEENDTLILQTCDLRLSLYPTFEDGIAISVDEDKNSIEFFVQSLVPSTLRTTGMTSMSDFEEGYVSVHYSPRNGTLRDLRLSNEFSYIFDFSKESCGPVALMYAGWSSGPAIFCEPTVRSNDNK